MQPILGGWGGAELDISRSTSVLYAASALGPNENNLSNESRGKGLMESFDFAYGVVADDVLRLQCFSIWIGVLAKILIF